MGWVITPATHPISPFIARFKLVGAHIVGKAHLPCLNARALIVSEKGNSIFSSVVCPLFLGGWVFRGLVTGGRIS